MLAKPEAPDTRTHSQKYIEPPTPDSATPWALIDQLVDQPFMPEGREQPEMPPDRVIFEN
jgi:antitoxin VapB